jgi:PAS domain S-box-containing protein
VKEFVLPLKATEKSYAFLMDEAGVLLYHPRKEYVGKTWDEIGRGAFAKRFLRVKEGDAQEGYFQTKEGPAGDVELIAFSSIEVGGRRLVLAGVTPMEDIAGPITTYKRRNGAFSALLFLIVAFGAYKYSQLRNRRVLLEQERLHLLRESELAEAVRETKVYLSTLLDSSPDAIISTDREGKVTFFSPGAEALLGYRREEIIDRSVVEVYESKERANEVMGQMHQRGGKVSAFESTLRAKDGSRIPVLISASLLYDEDSQEVGTVVAGTVGFSKDLRERKRAEEALEEAHRELHQTVLLLQEADEHKSRFISSMSHELRTPLNVVLGSADLLKGQHFGALNEKQYEYASLVEDSGKHLLDLINDVLDMAKIDAGKTEAHLQATSFDQLIHTVTSMMSSQFGDKRLALEVEVADPLKQPLMVDEKLCRQVLFNLLSNAAKFTPEGGRIGVKATMGDGMIQVSVSDTGIGIPQDQQEKIFSEFHRVDHKDGQQYEGTGLGLALTHRLVELMGGEIWVESEPGEGSTFHFTIALSQPEEIPVEDAAVEAQATYETTVRGCRILVAEDNDDNLAVVLDMLTTQEHEVAVARNGQEAVDLAMSFRPDLILMDVTMPIMDGLEATRQIRKIPEFNLLPIIALTASVGEEAEQTCLEAGCTAHLARPIQSAELLATLSTHLEVS